MVKSALAMLEQALPNLDGQAKKDVLRALSTMQRHMPEGAPVAGVQQTQIGDMLRSTVRNALLQKLMQNRSQQGTPGGPDSSVPGLPTGPSPSTPLPGA